MYSCSALTPVKPLTLCVVEAREAFINELNTQGAGYTEAHGSCLLEAIENAQEEMNNDNQG